jgi:hypothetical protein
VEGEVEVKQQQNKEAVVQVVVTIATPEKAFLAIIPTHPTV